ncbi:hypothetical protein GUJ93_ZPchr0002g26598 [Zizania palustris]|uniref:Uncharacterized protein n=1 Tax=Zizania palustris TaxID=103762 RepID=A0A8J5SJ36_ZIZPA|nr:hypothetical protein GUJ93_ZPchr0002g26598 [Zizania palustris]
MAAMVGVGEEGINRSGPAREASGWNGMAPRRRQEARGWGGGHADLEFDGGLNPRGNWVDDWDHRQCSGGRYTEEGGNTKGGGSPDLGRREGEEVTRFGGRHRPREGGSATPVVGGPGRVAAPREKVAKSGT